MKFSPLRISLLAVSLGALAIALIAGLNNWSVGAIYLAMMILIPAVMVLNFVLEHRGTGGRPSRPHR